MTDVPPRVLDGYRIVSELGRGGAGAVFLAIDPRDGAAVAIKTLLGDEPEEQLRFVREAYALASITSEEVVRVRDVITRRAAPYYVMDYVAGGSLQDRVEARGRLSERDARGLLRGLLAALEAVHARGLVHRDVKPMNVILRDDQPSRPVLIDFGLARLARDVGLTDPDRIVGTPEYLAPEAVRDGLHDGRSDLYAAGLAVRFALECRTPFDHLRDLELLEAVARGPGPFECDWLTPELAQLLTALCERRPADRPADAAEAQAWLAALPPPTLQDAPTRAIRKGA